MRTLDPIGSSKQEPLTKGEKMSCHKEPNESGVRGVRGASGQEGKRRQGHLWGLNLEFAKALFKQPSVEMQIFYIARQ